MRRLRFAPWVLATSLSFTSVARAGCCDDFWSCLATVATAGVSCQVQQLIDTVKALSETVTALFNDLSSRTTDIINDAKNQVVQSVEDVKREREQAIADLQSAVSQAHALNNPTMKAVTSTVPLATTKLAPNNATAAAPALAQAAPQVQLKNTAQKAPPPPADPTAVKSALKQAESYIQDLNTKGNAVANDAAAAERRARDAVVRHVVLANKIALDVGLQPLKLLGEGLLDLLSHPERLFDPSAQIEADLRRMSQEIPALLDRIGAEVTQEASRALEQAQAPTRQLQDQAAVAKSVGDAMQSVANSKLQSDLDGLNRLLPSAAPQQTKLLRGVILPSGITGRHELLTTAIGRLEVKKLPLIARHRASVSNIVTTWNRFKIQSKAAINVDAATTQKTSTQIAQLYRGKSKTEVDKKRQELTEEARRRFARDPKTLDQVIRYIQTH